jgi:hypothetical protein
MCISHNDTSFGLNGLEALMNVAFEAKEWMTAHTLLGSVTFCVEPGIGRQKRYPRVFHIRGKIRSLVFPGDPILEKKGIR